MTIPEAPESLTELPTATEVVKGRWARFRPALIMIVMDLIAIAVAAVLVRTTTPEFEAAAGFLLIINLMLWNLYQPKMTLSVLDDLPKMLASIITATATSAAIFVSFTIGSPGDLVYAAVLLVFLVPGRMFSYWFLRTRRRHSKLSARTIIIGEGDLARQLGQAMTDDPQYGANLIGYVDITSAIPEHALPAPVLGSLATLATVVGEGKVDRIVIAFPALAHSDLVSIVRLFDRSEAEIFIVPRLFEMTVRAGESEEIDGIPLLRLHRAPFRSPTWLLKRLMDITASGLALVLLSPIMGLIALINRVTDGPGIIFHQNRVGMDGEEFELLKFRSMRPANEQESSTNWNIKNDNRVSPFGKFLRRSSLDELPQLWNILRGDMSLVGPRPERPHFVEKFREDYDRYDARHRVPCGLTGWAQINGLRGDTSIEERARYDNYYIQNWSLWLDVKIILRTLTAFMKGSG